MNLHKIAFNHYKPLIEFASSDPTRVTICQRILAKDDRLYSTDGHRLVVLKNADGYFESGKIYDAEILKKTLNVVECHEKIEYPDIVGVIPKEDRFKHTIDWIIPQWLEKLGQTKRPAQAAFDMESGAVRLDQVSGDGFCGLNLALLKPFAGQAAKLRFIDKNSPVRVDFVDRPDDFAIIMPMRL